MSDLSVQQLSKSYGQGDESIAILDHLSLELNRGQDLAVIGPSGTGKSTLLQILGVLDRPSSGTVELEGKNPFTLNENQQAQSFLLPNEQNLLPSEGILVCPTTIFHFLLIKFGGKSLENRTLT